MSQAGWESCSFRVRRERTRLTKGGGHTSLSNSEVPKRGVAGSLSFLNKGQPPLPLMLFWEPWLWPAGKKGSFSLGHGRPGTGLPGKQSPVSGSNGHSEAQGLAGSASYQKKEALSLPHRSQRVFPPLLLGAQWTP